MWTHQGRMARISKATFTHARGGCGAEAGGFWHSRSSTAGMFTHTRSGRGRICHLLRTMMVWSARFRSGRGKLGVGPISCGADFAPAPPPLRDRACVNTCNDLCWSQFSARLRPRPPAHVWTYRKCTGPSLFQITTGLMFGATPLPEPMLNFCHYDPWERISVKKIFKIKIFTQEIEVEHFVCKWRPFLLLHQCAKMHGDSDNI